MKSKSQITLPIIILIIIAIMGIVYFSSSGLLSIVGSDEERITTFISPGTKTVSFEGYDFEAKVVNGYYVDKWYDCLCKGLDWNWGPDSSTDGRCSICTQIDSSGKCLRSSVDSTACSNGGFTRKGCYYTAKLFKDGILIDELNAPVTKINPLGVFDGGYNVLLDNDGVNEVDTKFRFGFGSSEKNDDGTCNVMKGSLTYIFDDKYLLSEVSVSKEEIFVGDEVFIDLKFFNDYLPVNVVPCIEYNVNTVFGTVKNVDCKESRNVGLGMIEERFVLNTSQAIDNLEIRGYIKDIGKDTSSLSGFSLRDRSSLPNPYLLGSVFSESVFLKIADFSEEIIEEEIVEEVVNSNTKIIITEKNGDLTFFEKIKLWFKNLSITLI